MFNSMGWKACLLFLLMVFGSFTSAEAVLINLGPGSFTPAAPVITFDEKPLGTVNPVYSFPGLAGIGDETVSFAGTFNGQTTTGTSVVTLANPQPSNPLSLNFNGPQTITANDSSSDTSPVLSGTPTFNGPISVLFSAPVAGVGLKGGFFNALNATTIQAFDAAGASLGSITNSQLGFEFYGLADSTGANVIKGISFYITGNEPAGFEIDNLTFGAAGVINRAPTIPEPSTILMLASGLAGVAGFRFFRRTK